MSGSSAREPQRAPRSGRRFYFRFVHRVRQRCQLMLARSAARERDSIRVRSRGALRIVRQLLAEASCLRCRLRLGLLVAGVVGGDSENDGPTNFPRLNELSWTPRAPRLTLMISLATGVLFGLFPRFRVATRS